MLASTCQPHKINLFYTSQGEAHCIQIGRKPQEQRRLNADIIETTRNIVLPSSEINSGGRETPVCKISKLLQILQNVARCCKVENLSKLKSENRETTTIELSVVDCPRKGEKPFFEILCNVADAQVLAIAAETRYKLQTGRVKEVAMSMSAPCKERDPGVTVRALGHQGPGHEEEDVIQEEESRDK